MDVEQIERDVARCTWHLLTGTQRSRRVQIQNKHHKKDSGILKKKQKRLANLINLTLCESYELAPSEDERLHYYQGYHDVACIFLHALGGGNTKPKEDTEKDEDQMGLELPARVLCQVSHSHFRDNMRYNFLSLQTALKLCLFPLLFKLDRDVHNHLRDSDMEPFFCLSWMITWFAHDVRDTQLVKRLFDAFLVSHPLFPLYVSIAMMLHPINRHAILSCDCDFAALHHCLSSLPRNSCRVGWKQRRGGGEGYVSDEEGGEERTLSTELDSTNWDATSYISNDIPEHSCSLATSATLGGSIVSSNSCQPSMSVGPVSVETSHDKVPFQKLVDTALEYMKRYPPRCLTKLAQRYYTSYDEGSTVEVAMGMPISLLQDLPIWSLAATAKADWVLKQRVRQDLGLKATSRKDRRRKGRLQLLPPVKEDATPLVDREYLATHQRTKAVIAAGFGPDPEKEKYRRRRRRRQRRMMQGALGIGMMAVMIGAYYMYQERQTTTPTILPEGSNGNGTVVVESRTCPAATVQPKGPFDGTTEPSTSTKNESLANKSVQDRNATASAKAAAQPTLTTASQKPLPLPNIESDNQQLFDQQQPLSSSEQHQSQPLMILEKMTLRLYRFVFYLFRPLRMLMVHMRNTNNDENHKGFFKVVLGSLEHWWKHNLATPKKILKM